MHYTITLMIPEHRTYDGILIERQEVTKTLPFACGDDVYYVHRKKWWKDKSPFVITKSRVTGMWATNIVGVTLDGSNHVSEKSFDQIFKSRTEAIECCLKLNEHNKVTIYGE